MENFMTAPTESNLSCPECGSKNLIKKIKKREIGDHLMGTELIDEMSYKCAECGEEVDSSEENDKLYDEAVKALSPKALGKMLDALNKKGITLAHLERCLNLPQRTTARWKKDGASAAATTLVKTVVTYPWLLEVAEKNFEPQVANYVLVHEGFKAADVLMKTVNSGPTFITDQMSTMFQFGSMPHYHSAHEVNEQPTPGLYGGAFWAMSKGVVDQFNNVSFHMSPRARLFTKEDQFALEK